VSLPQDRVFSLDWPRFEPARRALDHVVGLAELDRMYGDLPAGVTGGAFLAWTLDRLGVSVRVTDADLSRIPTHGPVVVVANHPFGGIEGIALARALLQVRPDVKLFANFLLGRIPQLRDLLLFVDPFARRGSAHVNASALRGALTWLSGGGLLAVFPAGEVASIDLAARRVADPAWSPAIAGLARRSGATAIPVFFPGRNRAFFQIAGLIHPALRTALLPRELLARRASSIELRVGTPVPPERLCEFATDERAIAYLRDRTEILAERADREARFDDGAIQPRRTPVSAAPVVPSVPAAELAAEVAALPEEAHLIASDDLHVYVARAHPIPKILREIGRLREVTFREVGEGTGREIDLDAFDAAYWHLFLWNRAGQEVVGAYRLGPTDEIIAASGTGGLYSASLFKYDPRLFEAMGPALEMGRSFIRTEHQKTYTGLMLLWKGIGEFVGRHPRYATLFGPVSISADYRSLSQRLIVAFLERNRKLTGLADWVRPRNPFREARRPGTSLSPAHLGDLEEVSSFISEIEADQKGVPILLKQYLRLDGRLLGYNVDPDFASVLDVLIVVDLRQTAPKALQRYMGRANLERFRAFHGAGHSAFSYRASNAEAL
jgi:putative hemolysin